MPSRTSCRIVRISSGRGGRVRRPIASSRTLPLGTSIATFTALARSKRRKYSSTLDHFGRSRDSHSRPPLKPAV